jgi:hypothetical protein
MATMTCPNPKCGAVLSGSEKFCRLCGHPVTGRWEDETVTIDARRGTGMAFGNTVVVGGTLDYVNDCCDVFARVKGYAQKRMKMRAGEVLMVDGGDLGFFEITLMDFDHNLLEFLVTKLRKAPNTRPPE